jgi:GYF domain 2
MSAPDDVVWYVSRDGQRVGPLSADEFERFEEGGGLSPTDQVWQTGMTGWVAYKDYGAARFASPRPLSPSTGRSGLSAMTNTLKGALHSVSKTLAKIGSVSIHDADASPMRATEDARTSIARPSLDPHPVSIHPLPVGTREPGSPPLASKR